MRQLEKKAKNKYIVQYIRRVTMAKESRKISSENEAYKSRGMKAAKGGNPGKPEGYELKKPDELHNKSKDSKHNSY